MYCIIINRQQDLPICKSELFLLTSHQHPYVSSSEHHSLEEHTLEHCLSSLPIIPYKLVASTITGPENQLSRASNENREKRGQLGLLNRLCSSRVGYDLDRRLLVALLFGHRRWS
jgi:hypothetical protein